MEKDKKIGRIQLFLVLIFIVGSVVLSKFLESDKLDSSEYGANERIVSVEVKEINNKDHRIRFKTTGVIEAKSIVNITAQVSGRVVKVSEGLFPGGTFMAGEELFEIEPADYILEVQRAEAEVARASTALDIEKAEVENAEFEWRELNGNKKATSLALRGPQLQEAEANYRAAEAALRKARLNLERTSFYLPFNGHTIASNITQGQYIQAGQNYGQVFDEASLEVRTSLTKKQMEWLIEAEEPIIKIFYNYLGKDYEYLAELQRGITSIDNNTRFANVNFTLKKKNLSDRLQAIPGIFVNIEILGKKFENVSVIDSDSLQKDGKILLVNSENKIHIVQPNILLTNGSYLVVEKLDDSMKLVTTSLNGATEGMSVEISTDNFIQGAQ